MVRFEKDRYVIEIPVAGISPVEDWLDLHDELTYVLELMDAEHAPRGGLYRLAGLLRAMMPEYGQALRLTDFPLVDADS